MNVVVSKRKFLVLSGRSFGLTTKHLPEHLTSEKTLEGPPELKSLSRVRDNDQHLPDANWVAIL